MESRQCFYYSGFHCRYPGARNKHCVLKDMRTVGCTVFEQRDETPSERRAVLHELEAQYARTNKGKEMTVRVSVVRLTPVKDKQVVLARPEVKAFPSPEPVITVHKAAACGWTTSIAAHELIKDELVKPASPFDALFKETK